MARSGHYEKRGDIEEWVWDVPVPVEPAPEALAEEEPDTGTGPYEGRTVAQLRVLAKSKELSTSGSKEDLIERLRA